jgi:hypothetical protein
VVLAGPFRITVEIRRLHSSSAISFTPNRQVASEAADCHCQR